MSILPLALDDGEAGELMRIQDHKNTAIDQLAAMYASFSWY